MFWTGLGGSFSQQLAEDTYSNDDESYDPSDEDAPVAASIDSFQTKMQDALEKFCLTQDASGAQLVELIKSSCRYTDKLA